MDSGVVTVVDSLPAQHRCGQEVARHARIASTFKRQCRECGIPKDIHDAITGHPSADVAGHYGGQYPIKPLADAIKTLRYPGLDLSGVKRA
jgi:hypothetical protein